MVWIWNGFDLMFFFIIRQDLQDIVDSFFACGETSFGRRPFYPDDPVNPVYCFF